MEIYKNREEAGLLLAEKLRKYQGSNSVVLAVPRGGVPVGYVIAKTLQLPLDIVLSKKIGHPSNPEYAIGAVSADSVIIAPNIPVSDIYIEREIARLQKLIREKYDYFKKGKKPVALSGKNIILVDDGIATGRTLMASIEMLRKQNPAKIIVATPVLPLMNLPIIQSHADEVIYLSAPEYFSAVGQFYQDFTQTEDEEVIRLLNEENTQRQNSQTLNTLKELQININLSDVTLKGDLVIPENAKGLVIFSHGSGSSRLSSRNKLVAQLIQKQHIATLLFDLLTQEEDLIYENRFNIGLISKRLIETTNWILEQIILKDLPIGYFGASTGAASALRAAAHFGNKIKAVVSRGGRPDLALQELPSVNSPTLLIVGGEDFQVIEMNKEAFEALNCIKELKIIPGATHLFEEPGKLTTVAELAISWYLKYLI